MTEGTLLKTALNNSAEVTEIRRAIHRHPEIGRNEFKTSELIRKKLTEYGVDEIKSYTPTSVVAIIKGGMGEGRCLAIRADIDALPVTEDTGLPFASEVEGMMHACGHDMHAAMLLGVAKMLCGMRDRFKGTVKLIFQHSEDTLPGGAKELTEKGVMEDPKVDAIFGMHIMPDEKECGKLAFIKGPITTSVDLYEFTVKGKSGHGAAPHQCVDAAVVTSAIVSDLQTIVSREIDPMDPAVVTVGVINVGERWNVVPEKGRIEGTMRCFSDYLWENLPKMVDRIAENAAKAFRAEVTTEYVRLVPPTNNNPVMADIAKSAAKKIMGEDAPVALPATMGGEDFAFFMEKAPGAVALLGVRNEECGAIWPQHSSHYRVDENALVKGAMLYVQTAMDFNASK